MADYEASRASPLSDIPSENGGNTMEKALIKRNVMIRNLNGHYRAASYVPVGPKDNNNKEQQGSGQRQACAFWILVGLLLVVASGNLVLTFTVLGVLRLGHGMESLELVDGVVKFYGLTDLDEIIKRDGRLEGFKDSPVSITADGAEAIISILNPADDGPKITVRPDGIAEITNVVSFDIRGGGKGRDKIFSTGFPNFGLPRGVRRLDVQAARVARVASPVNAGLSLGSDSYITMRGNEGTRIEGKEVVWSADQDLWLRSVNGSVVLKGRQGVALDVQGLPLVSTSTSSSAAPQFKLCVCGDGRLFRARLPASCTHNHPCQA